MSYLLFFFFSSRRRHTRWNCDWSSDVCSSDLPGEGYVEAVPFIGALCAEAARRGARILPGRRVTGIIRAGARVRGVSTEGGDRFEADWVVDCAGVAMGEITRLAGLDIALDRVPGRLIYTSPVATTLR